MIYLDNAATSHPKPPCVYERVDYVLRHCSANPGRSGHRMAAEADRMIFETRESLAQLFGIRQSDRIVFTSNTTGALNLALQGFLRPGDHCVTTSMEHNSVVRVLHALSGAGVRIEKVPATPQGIVQPEVFGAAITEQTSLVVMTHASNVTGAITPVAEVAALAHARGVPLLVDAAQTSGAVPIDVEEMGIDLLACPGHKGLLGPQGTGFLYVGPGITLRPILFGGTGSRSDLSDMPDFLPDRYEAGTLNTPGIAGLGASSEFLLQTGVETVRRHEAALSQQLVDGLGAIDGVRLHGVAEPCKRTAVVLFTIDGIDPASIGDALDSEFDIAVRVGIHCAPDAHRSIGTYPIGGVRMSPGFFNTADEIDRALYAVRVIARRRR